MADKAKPKVEYEDEAEQLPGIRQISNAAIWLEALITALSGYALTVAMGIGVVDILTDGQLTTSSPYLTYVYGISMAAGIGGQLVGLSFRSARSFSQGKWLRGLAFLCLVAVLSYLEYISANAFSYHKAFGVPTVQTLHDLGWDQRSFIQFRNGVAVGLIILSGFLRYAPKRKKSIAELQADADRKVALAEIANRTRQADIANAANLFGGIGKAARQAIASARAPETSTNPSNALATAYDAQEAALPPLADASGVYSASHPTLQAYQLPDGVTLTTEGPMTYICSLIGVKRDQLSEAWKYAQMTYHPAKSDQPASTKNIAVWQVLALYDSGLLADAPSNVTIREQSTNHR